MNVLAKIFGSSAERLIKKLEPTVQEINVLEPEFEKLSNEDLKNKENFSV